MQRDDRGTLALKERAADFANTERNSTGLLVADIGKFWRLAITTFERYVHGNSDPSWLPWQISQFPFTFFTFRKRLLSRSAAEKEMSGLSDTRVYIGRVPREGT
jgi:hypothetical protein